jgi:hypothetical protein
MKTNFTLGISTVALLGVVSFLHNSSPAFATDPLNDPDNKAWELFVQANTPSLINKDVVSWETWTPAARVFANATVQPQVPAKFSGRFELSKSIRAEMSSNPPDLPGAFKDAEPQLCSDDLTDHKNQVMLNDAMVGYIVQNELYNVEGQIAASKKAEIQFPPDSIAVKAVWDVIGEEDANQYYSRKCGTSRYGLVALHIISKRTKDWLWTTFEHISTNKHNRRQCTNLECVDTFGASPTHELRQQRTPQLIELLSQNFDDTMQRVWSNYRLVGTQVKFADAEGKPILMGNSILEAGVIGTSSCMTCHSRSTISEDKTRLKVGQSDNTGFVGNPNACWYLDQDGQIKYYKLDYVWSLSLAKRKDSPLQGAPPSSANCGKETGLAIH